MTDPPVWGAGAVRQVQRRFGPTAVLLAIVAALGVLAIALIGLDRLRAPGPFPEQRPYDHYFLAAALWGIAIGVVGILLAVRRPRALPCSPGELLFLTDLSILLAFFWPIEAMAVSVVVAARARRRPGRQRAAALALGALALVGGTWWGCGAYDEQDADMVGWASADQLAGSWHEVAGPGHLELGADGHFTLRHATAALDHSLPPGRTIDVTGSWALQDQDRPMIITLTVSPDVSSAAPPDRLSLDVEALGASTVLCPDADPDVVCGQDGLHR
ncbi:hypothetical protein [Kitasatospora sp. NBC_01266]|uniref:hypothetical protein n=1 Tax=Kitasatospora sp. NBC_01266 TaxID=2903572 RepID=UPI002E35E042|nr:hypothetical protein [Kitasatospora sp. NBC_01266]